MNNFILQTSNPMELLGLSQAVKKNNPKAKIFNTLNEAEAEAEAEADELILIAVVSEECENYHVDFFELKNKNKKLKILIIGEKPSDSLRFIKQNIDGFLLRKSSETEFLACLKHMEENKILYIEESSLNYIKSKIVNPDPELTRQEKKIMCYLAKGFNAHEIANKLECSPKTINVHKNNMKIKLNLTSSSELIRLALGKFND